MMLCVLLAPPTPALSLMSGVPDAEKLTSNQSPQRAPGQDHSGIWLRNAATGLCLLAAAAAVVSFTAQYRMVDATRRLALVAGLEAAIPDAAALVFACLGIALALHGRRAVRARILNLASVGTSVFMNTIAAGPGWRNLAVWAMPPVAYALASDTLTLSSERRRSPVTRTWAPPWPRRRGRRWPWPAGWCCGCCAWPWRLSPRWPGSAPGSWGSARSPPAAVRPPDPGRPPRRARPGTRGRPKRPAS